MTYPFPAFNFRVRLQIDGESRPICEGEFSEVAGLEVSMEAHTIREGGNNARQIHLVGPVTYGQLTLKRGMTANVDLWRWFRETHQNRSLRASGEIVMLSADRATENARFALTGCLPLKVVAPSLNAQDGILAIEEIQIGYETLEMEAGA
jgi:phage tail-like protein